MVLLLAACHSPDGPTHPGHHPPAGTGWADVAPILGEHCGGCHEEGGVSGIPLETWSEVNAARDVVGWALESGIMPPWPAAPADYPFVGDPTLSPDDLALVQGWIADDAPLGDADPELLAPAPEPITLPAVSVNLTFPAPYTPTGAIADDYRCLALVPSGPIGPYIRGYQVTVGNLSVVHHAKLLAVYPEDGGATLAADEALDPEPGFACSDELDPDFGGPGVLMGGWLPGSAPTVFPDDAGLPLGPGVVFVLVMHYHPTATSAGSDDTSVQLWTAPSVARPVDPARLTNLDWRLPPEEGGLLIPAGASDVEVKSTERVSALKLRAFDPLIAGVDLLSVQFHMHKLGTHGSVTLTRGGESSTLIDIPAWNFDWQLAYWLDTPVHLAPEDQLTLECHWDNSAGTEDVSWGEGTEDEMCSAIVNLVPPP